MDILDIDEALKDDSFIFLEDKTHDDVSNILQQWKSNNCLLQQQSQQQQQNQQPEQAYKLNSRTFTRPKRKSAQNLESHFSNSSQCNPQLCNGSPVLNLEIGGLVTTMQKSFLQDTSPPSSICSSMDISVDRMNNSLITSADFININFLQSTNGLDFNATLSPDFDLTNKVTNDGYTLNDMIRDRKALESLSMSGDGTLIKDCNIAQIDDISLALSKTASGCSTMDNSTESMEANNRTIQLVNNQNVTREASSSNIDSGIMQKTMILQNELITDTTFNLVEDSICNTLPNVTYEHQSEKIANQTFKKPTPLLDKTTCLSSIGNISFDYQEHTTDERCITPENISINSIPSKLYESTPQAASVRKSRQQYTPTIKNCVDVNISPIIPINSSYNLTRVLSESFERDDKTEQSKVNSDTFCGGLPNLEPMEMIEDIKNPNEIFGRSYNITYAQNEADNGMQSVMDLAQAEAELLAGNNDEEEFEHMLDEFSRVELNAEQLKMKKSLDSIKKRFTYGFTENNERELSCEAKDMRETMKYSSELNGVDEQSIREECNMTINIKLRDSINEPEELKSKLSKTFYGNARDLKESPDSLSYNLTTSTLSTSASTSGERLLNRRGRLYDDINLSSLSMPPKSLATSSTSQNHDKELKEIVEENKRQKTETQAEVNGGKTEGYVNGKANETITADIKNDVSEPDIKSHRLAERRERDRDRFKTIKIVKQRTMDNEDGENVLNVPCIDDDNDITNDPNITNIIREVPQRLSRRDQISPSLDPVDIYSNVSELDDENSKTKAKHTNYLTYKKPKEKVVKQSNPESVKSSENNTLACGTVAKTRLEQRSLSRPRYISGLQKFNVVSKATSAGDLEKTDEVGASKQLDITAVNSGLKQTKKYVTTSNVNHTQSNIRNNSNVKELKSPMGIKAKSFHNLSSNFGYSSATTGQKTYSSGIKNKSYNSGVLTENQTKVNSVRTNHNLNTTRTSNTTFQHQQQKNDESVFKVPKLVSGIRAPSGTCGVKRAGLVRPSSGYYSLNVTSKNVPSTSDFDIDAGRQSPTESMSSASSRSSAQSVGLSVKAVNAVIVPSDSQLPSTITKITTGPTGIPKPSGLKPPTNIKRSGLPRPASIVRR